MRRGGFACGATTERLRVYSVLLPTRSHIAFLPRPRGDGSCHSNRISSLLGKRFPFEQANARFLCRLCFSPRLAYRRTSGRLRQSVSKIRCMVCWHARGAFGVVQGRHFLGWLQMTLRLRKSDLWSRCLSCGTAWNEFRMRPWRQDTLVLARAPKWRCRRCLKAALKGNDGRT